MADIETLLHSFIGLLDVMAELYLGSIFRPLLLLHEEISSKLNNLLRKILNENPIPDWLTANLIAYSRAILVVPTISLLAGGQLMLPAVFVLVPKLFSVFHQVVITYWIDVKKAREEEANEVRPTSKSPATSDDDDYEYEVVTTGSPQRMNSWSLNHRNRTYANFLNDLCDKAFSVPCWIYLLSTIHASSFRSIQYLCLWWLILTELASGCLRFKAYYGSYTPAPQVEGIELETHCAIEPKYLQRAKETLELLGTALFILPYLRYIGVILLSLACPLAYESIRVKKRVMYVVVCGSSTKQQFDHKLLKFWTQTKALGSKLIVGVVDAKATDMVCNACSSSCVDEVIAEAPAKADLMFLERQKIDYVVFHNSSSNNSATTTTSLLVTDEVIGAGVCLVIGDDHVVRPLRPKERRE